MRGGLSANNGAWLGLDSTNPVRTASCGRQIADSYRTDATSPRHLGVARPTPTRHSNVEDSSAHGAEAESARSFHSDAREVR